MARKRCEDVLSVYHITSINFPSVARVKSTLLLLLLFSQCLAAVREAFASVEAALMGGNVGQVAADFSCCQIPKGLDDQVTSML